MVNEKLICDQSTTDDLFSNVNGLTGAVVTVTQHLSTQMIGGVLTAPDSTLYTLEGCDVTQLGALFDGVRTRGSVSPNLSLATCRSFYYTGSVMELLYWGYGTSFDLYVNGSRVAFEAVPSNGTDNFVLVQFDSQDTYFIELYGQSELFKGINIEPTGTIAPAARLSTKRIAFHGDSFTEGTGSTNKSSGYVAWFRKLFGVRDVWNSGYGGTGYIASISSNSLIERIPTDLAPYNPDVIIVAAGVNDSSSTEAAFTTAVDAYYAALQAQCPTSTIIICSLFLSTEATGKFVNFNNILKAKALALGVDFIDMVGDEWVTGFGSVSSPSGSGNADILMDGGHPNDEGALYIANRLGVALKGLGVI